METKICNNLEILTCHPSTFKMNSLTFILSNLRFCPIHSAFSLSPGRENPICARVQYPFTPSRVQAGPWQYTSPSRKIREKWEVIAQNYGIFCPFRSKLAITHTIAIEWKDCLYCFLFDSLHPINNLSVKQGRVFLGWTSTKLG